MTVTGYGGVAVESQSEGTQEEGIQIYKHELDMFEACKKYKYKN